LFFVCFVLAFVHCDVTIKLENIFSTISSVAGSPIDCGDKDEQRLGGVD
jgi:hypothetical protein